jgi:hypothetical protein
MLKNYEKISSNASVYSCKHEPSLAGWSRTFDHEQTCESVGRDGQED